MIEVLVAGAGLALKHAIADGVLQTKYQYANKGKFLHPGGLLHAGIHAGGTFIATSFAFLISFDILFAFYLSITLAWADFAIHYLIDYIKTNVNADIGWCSMGKDVDGRACLRIYDDKYFWALVADQAAHFLTYAFFIWLVSEAVA